MSDRWAGSARRAVIIFELTPTTRRSLDPRCFRENLLYQGRIIQATVSRYRAFFRTMLQRFKHALRIFWHSQAISSVWCWNRETRIYVLRVTRVSLATFFLLKHYDRRRNKSPGLDDYLPRGDR